MAKVFISYSRKDIDFAKRLTGELQKSKLDFWIDWEGIPPTVDWWREIEKGIEESDAFLFLISPDSTNSKVCGQEIDHAVKNGKRLIPLVIRDTKGEEVHPKLSPLNWIFFRETDDFDASIKKLLTSIHTDYDWVEVQRRLQVRALEWERNRKENSFLLRGKDLGDAELQLATNSSKEPYPTDLQREYVFESRKAADRQRRIVTGISIAGVIALAALALFGFYQSGQSANNASTAQANLVVAQTAQIDAQNRQTLADNNAATAIANEQARATAQANAEAQTKLATSQKLVYKSQNLASEQQSISLLLAAEANNIHSDISTVGSLLYTLQSKPHNIKYFHFENEDYTYAPEVIISPDSQFIVGIFNQWKTESYKLIIWNIQTGNVEFEKLFAYDELSIKQIFFSKENTLVITNFKNHLFVLDFRNKTIEDTGITVDILASSADGTFFLSRNTKGISIWDTETFSRIKVVELDPITISGKGIYILSKNGDYLVTVEEYSEPTQHRKIAVIDLTTGTIKQSFELPSGKNFGYFDITINYSGSILAYSISNDSPLSEVSVIDTNTGKVLWKTRNRHYKNIDFYNDSTMVGNILDEISFFDANTGQIVRQIDSPGIGFWSFDYYSADGALLARPLFDSIALIQLGPGYSYGKTISNTSEKIKNLGFSKDGNFIYSITENGNIISQDLELNESPKIIKVTDFDYGSRRWSISLDTISRVAVTIDDNYSLDCWNIDSGTKLAHIDNPSKAWINSYAIQNNLIAIVYDIEVNGGSAGRIEIWDITNKIKVDELYINPDNQLYPYGSWVNGVLFSPDGKTLAVAVYASISFYDLQSHKFVAHTPTLHSNDIHRMAYSQDGGILVSGGSDGSVIMWDTNTGKQIGKSIFVNSSDLLAISPKKDILVTGGEKFDEILLWNLITGEQIGLPLEGQSYYGSPIAFNLAGDQLAVLDSNNEIIIWQLSSQVLGDLACTTANRNLTVKEWNQYIGDVLPYQAVCPNFPIESEVTTTP